MKGSDIFCPNCTVMKIIYFVNIKIVWKQNSFSCEQRIWKRNCRTKRKLKTAFKSVESFQNIQFTEEKTFSFAKCWYRNAFRMTKTKQKPKQWARDAKYIYWWIGLKLNCILCFLFFCRVMGMARGIFDPQKASTISSLHQFKQIDTDVQAQIRETLIDLPS